MNEQSGRGEPAGRPESGQPRDADRPGPGRSQQPGRRQPGADVLSDLQRWLIRSSARNMRNQFEDQVRRTIGGQRSDNSDVWDVATTEIPPEVGESPECQWCPICRAARRMRDSRPGLGGQLSGAGDAVATAVGDAIHAFDSFLGKAAGGGKPEGSPDTSPDQEPKADPPGPAAHQPEAPSGAGTAGRPDSLSGEHGPVGWKPGDRLSTAGAAVVDPWAVATGPREPDAGATSGSGTNDSGATGSGTNGSTTNGTNSDGSPGSSSSGGPDGQGHGPSDRG